MISRFVETFLLAGTALVQNIDPRLDQIVQSYVSNKPIHGNRADSAWKRRIVQQRLWLGQPGAGYTHAQGRATQMTLHQNGRDITGKRLDDTEFKRLSDAASAVAKRVKDQTAAPGSEAALRRLIEESRSGQPNYDLMSPGLAAATRQQLPQIQANIVRLGAVKTILFKGVGPAGADIYEVKFENGSLEYRIFVAADGKIEGANMRPVP